MKAKSTESAQPLQARTPDEHKEQTQHTRQGLLYVCVAVLFFATSPIFVRWSQPFSAVEIAFWRLSIATLIVIVMGWLTRQSLRLPRQQWQRFALYGLVTALHFCFYIAALSFTTIAHGLALTYTSPIFVALFARLFLRETLAPHKIVGILITIVGIAVMAGFEPAYGTCTLPGQCMLLGDSLALLSALCYAIYSVAGRGERERHPLFRYTSYVYGLAALWLFPIMLIFAFGHAYPLSAIGAVAALGIFPLGLGHTLYNASLRKIHAAYANVIATQEVTIGVLLGIIFVHDIPSISTIIGVAITMLGILSVIIEWPKQRINNPTL